MKRWGGPRRGAGRPKGDPEKHRRNRVTVLLTDAEMRTLEALAEERELPLGTAAYEIVARSLRRRNRKEG